MTEPSASVENAPQGAPTRTYRRARELHLIGYPIFFVAPLVIFFLWPSPLTFVLMGVWLMGGVPAYLHLGPVDKERSERG